jgi:Cu2+-exporting ATPase
LPAAAYAGQPFFQSAWRAIKTQQLNMDVPISVGVLLALAMSLFETTNHAEHAYFDSAVMLLFFLLCGRYLEHAMRRRTCATAGNLAALRAEIAHRFDGNGELVRVPAAALRPGDRILVHPGERVPADGVVISGTSEIDESLVSGETTPRKVADGMHVFCGSMNFAGALTLLVTAAGQSTLLDQIECLLEKAVSAKSRYVRLADRAARLYAPLVHATALLTGLGWLAAGASLHDSVITAIAVLIITCPCALALAIPAVQVVATGSLFRAGIILNSADAIERLAEADTVVFDKTGTLTLPELRVANAFELDPELLEVAARLALSSRHPLAQALAREARASVPYDNALEEPGRGLRAVIAGSEARLGSPAFCGVATDATSMDAATSSIVFSHGGCAAHIAIRQQLRPDAGVTVTALRRLGLEVIILSGDRAVAVEPVAAKLAVRNWSAGLKPADKIAILDALKAQGHRVLMVGDGLNDAPALAAAHVSFSPISASHLAQAQADAVFLGESLRPVLQLLTVARRAHRRMQENLALAVIYNVIAVPIAISGHISPLLAALAMSGSSVLVTLNALRARAPTASEPHSRLRLADALQPRTA